MLHSQEPLVYAHRPGSNLHVHVEIMTAREGTLDGLKVGDAHSSNAQHPNP